MKSFNSRFWKRKPWTVEDDFLAIFARKMLHPKKKNIENILPKIFEKHQPRFFHWATHLKSLRKSNWIIWLHCAPLVFPNHLQFQNCQGAEEYFSEIFAICLEKSTARTGDQAFGEFFLLGSYLPNTSPSHQLAGPGWAHGPFLKMIRIASPLKKTPTSKNVQQKHLLTKVCPPEPL